MRALSRLRSASLLALTLPFSGCGGDTVEVEPICARARILPIDPVMVTPTGRVLQWLPDRWEIGQLEVDGTLTPIATLATTEHGYFGWLEHDPVSGRMWVLESDNYFDDGPPSLWQFDADGQLEWMTELTDYERPVGAGSLHYHEGSLYVSLTMDGVWPADPLDPVIYRSLIIERRDLSGAVLWARNDYAPPNTSELFSSALLIGVSGSALSIVATPPLIDYGPSFPLTIDIETGGVLWSGADGHDPLRMAVGDARLYLGWEMPSSLDPDRLPERVVLAPPSTSLSVHAPSTGEQTNLGTIEWPALAWSSPGWDQDFAFGSMGPQLVSVIVSDGVHGVAVHDADGELLCQGRLDLQFDSVGRGVGLEGRDQFVVRVGVTPEGSEGLQDELGLLLIEPNTDG